MSAISRRIMITRGLAAAAGLSGLAVAERIADRYGLVPPDHGGIYGPGETLTYAAQRLLTRHSLAREFSRSQISNPPFANEIAPLGEHFKRLQADGFADWRLSVEGLVAQPASLSLDERQAVSRAPADHRNRVRRRLVVRRRVDRDAAGRRPARRRHHAAGALRRLFFDRSDLVGEHRHGRCAASADAARLRDERRRPAGRASAVRCGCGFRGNSATRASNSSIASP